MRWAIGRERRKYIYAVGTFLLCAIMAWACGRPVLEPTSVGAAPPAQQPAPTRKLEFARAEVVVGRRITQQPGSIHAFESVDLHAMVLGYLKTQHVDIGSRVTKGEVLAVIDVPREESLVGEAAALLQLAKAQALQAESKVKTAEADRKAADATAAHRESDIDRLVANKKLAEAQYARVKGLVEERAVDVRLRDEQQRDFESAIAAERTARLHAQTAHAESSAAASRVEQAEADVAAAQAAVSVAEARLTKARVDVKYAVITAPFDGVITRRNHFPGGFIGTHSAATKPLLTVERTDRMRVVVQVPDRDVALTNVGDPVALTVDGLSDREFRGTVSRTAEHEDPTTRTMRVEIDIPNSDGLLRDGMYGRATIELSPAVKRLMLPLDCVLDRSPKGAGAVFVVRRETIQRIQVELGPDDGKRIEIKSGITAEDEVVRAPDPSLKSGTPIGDRT
ncbi:MAG TPA: efflux RND transporter periplasmic adaptor subunit [Pirellulales bacterium]|nr:efflux RND transporter periplasmic adaptor subunit [Pirellulales bacterium]